MNIVKRTVAREGQDTNEVLILIDEFNVSGAYLRRAAPGQDEQGRPCLDFTLSQKGGQLFAALTGKNLPDPVTEETRKLGIILDGRLFSAPSIQSRIHERGQITGSFTSVEVEELAAVLKAGTLPARLKRTGQRSPLP